MKQRNGKQGFNSLKISIRSLQPMSDGIKPFPGFYRMKDMLKYLETLRELRQINTMESLKNLCNLADTRLKELSQSNAKKTRVTDYLVSVTSRSGREWVKPMLERCWKREKHVANLDLEIRELGVADNIDKLRHICKLKDKQVREMNRVCATREDVAYEIGLGIIVPDFVLA